METEIPPSATPPEPGEPPVEPPGAEARDVEVPDVEAPGAEAAGTATVEAVPEVEPPDVVAPAVGTSAVETPEVARPDMERFYAQRAASDARAIRTVVSWLSVSVATVFTLLQVHPERIFRRNTPTGGDMGAHVWAPAFLRDHLLPNFRIQGWSMDWYAGLPVYRFYMLPPALLMTVLNGLLQFPYGVAFKIVAVLGVVTLPLCCWAFGRMALLPWPIPELLAFGGVMFLFDENFTIYGGNIPSTMAGEFSFSIALSLAMLGFGLLTRGMRTGKGLGLAAVVLALAAVSHGIVAIFVAAGSIVMVLLWIDFRDRRRLVWGTAALATMGLLTAWWILPFKMTTKYMTNMHYEPYTGPWWKFFHPQSQQMTLFLLVFAAIGFVACIVRVNRAGAWLGIMGLLWIALVFAADDADDPLPFVGDLFWNYRGLPFVYLTRYLMAMVGVGETIHFLVRYARLTRDDRRRRAALPLTPERDDLRATMFQFGAIGVIGAITLGWIGFGIDRLPWMRQIYDDGKWKHEWTIDLPFTDAEFRVTGDVVDDGADSDGWSAYNFDGYEGREAWNEYRALLDTSKQLGAQRGCGRALWEHQSDKYGSYGTPMALMLLPFWTDGCIGSMEGLFFEASGTTPYHFLAASAVSENASDPVRQLRYTKANLDLGVPYLRELGVRYYYAFTPKMVEEAAQRDDLVEVAVSGPWHIYEVRDWSLVVPLDTEPIVVRGRGGDQRDRWLEVGLSWFQNRDEWGALLVADGPDEWQRITAQPDLDRRQTDPNTGRKDRVDYLQTDDPYETRPVEPFTIDPTTVRLGQSSIEFDVPPEAIGRPVLVRVSYFPNWEASGADGPYRAAPNFMVVVPRSTHVELHYGYSKLDLFSYFLTAVGIGLVVFFWRGRRVDFDSPRAPRVPRSAPAADESTEALPIQG